MARKRAISPTIWDDPTFGKLSPYAKILFIGLISLADDDGRQRGDKYYLKSNFFKRDKWGPDWVERVKEELCSIMKNVKHYRVGGEEYIQLLTWEKYQKQQKERRVPSQFPPPSSDDKQVLSECLADDKQVSSQVKLSKVKLSKDNTKVLQPYGREDINQCFNFLKEKIGGSPDGSVAENRRFAKLLLDRFKKDYPDKPPEELVCSLIGYGLQDSFHGKNITSFKYLYYNAQKIIQSVRGAVKNTQAIEILKNLKTS